MARFLITLPSREHGGRGARPDFPGPVTDLRRAYGPFDHLAQVGRAAEIAAFHGALAPFDPEGEESLVVAAGVLRQSRWLRAVAEFHPGIATPVYAAKVSASLQRFSTDRLDWKLAVDLDRGTARAQGDFLEGPDRYARAEEFLTVAKGVWSEEGYTYEGRFYQVLAGGFQPPLAGRLFPRIHLSGTSKEALELSARHADVHVFDPEDDIEAAGLPGVAYGLRIPVLARDDDDEAWEAARRLWRRDGGTAATLPDPDPRTRLWRGFAPSRPARAAGPAGPSGRAVAEAAGSLGTALLGPFDTGAARHSPAEAAGLPGTGGPFRSGLVGAFETVAAGIRDYIDRGVGVFFLEAAPYIEETYRLGERLLPLLAKESAHVR
ncbi:MULTISPECIES: LLM class flavin-dependent oxidoreductase [Streptosporangium]|uniref:Alkanesulfonate monooxygenase n=1 Tax=Streptosporangium brasiliense TaxID=47480 RepID=A0ABT9R904_9ACTN|nr:LLM class flavin-dependent oxidoreductase [Streptosporangium brasiliense]MDP9865725.1 alkanesulfonate monooxygenase [Streptosporangium brasiliense]